jgi:hypothetical protein
VLLQHKRPALSGSLSVKIRTHFAFNTIPTMNQFSLRLLFIALLQLFNVIDLVDGAYSVKVESGNEECFVVKAPANVESTIR